MEDLRVSTSVHGATERTKIEVEGNNSNGAYWVTIAIGSFVLTVFAPSLAGSLYIMEELGNGTLSRLAEERVVVKKPELRVEMDVEITAYNAEEEQTDSTPLITASGRRVHESYCALSRDIEEDFGLEFGDIVHIEGFGDFEFQDRMNKRIKRGVDIFRWDRQEALEIGRREGVISFLIKDPEQRRKNQLEIKES